MHFFELAFSNLLNGALISFAGGWALAYLLPGFKLPQRIHRGLTIYILFSIGLKGGVSCIEHAGPSSLLLIVVLLSLVLWGFIQPLFSFYLLKKWLCVDRMTAAAIAASFGSVSVMTFVTALSFLDRLEIGYEQFTLVALAILEVPAIISGIFLAKLLGHDTSAASLPKWSQVLRESLLNQAIVSIILGFVTGMVLSKSGFGMISDYLVRWFQPLLCLFLFDIGLHVGSYRHHFRSFSWSLTLFGIYMPLIGGAFGLLLSYLLNLNVGTATLMASLTASASYIAVPAAMRMAVPEAREAVYLPLSLGIAFPFNVIIGIPLYYYCASRLLH